VPGLTLLKPAAIGDAYGLKVASLFPGNTALSLAPVQGFVALLDPRTGTHDAIVDAAAVTEIRTAAVSAVATDLLAREDARALGLLGSGAQARSHLLALSEWRSLDCVRVWSPHGAEAFVTWAKEQGVDVRADAGPEEVVRSSDIVCTLTTSSTPVLRGAWLQPGTHVNAVGAFRPTDRELDADAIARATVVVDDRAAAAAEAGAILLAQQEGAIGDDHVTTDLSGVLLGAHRGRTRDDEITVFASTGLAIQDVATARALVEVARAVGAGHEVSFE
jgi:ornithine cyclodeaminase/alanine dehydrogenase-like protein (mu-crystallin family)